MSGETFSKNTGEKAGESSRLATLESEAGKFNKEAALRNRAEAERKMPDKKSEHLIVIEQEPKKLSPYEEYCGLLEEISSDFAEDTNVNKGKTWRADSILRAEIAWRENNEEIQKRQKQCEEQRTKITEEYSKKGFLGKLFGKRKFQKQLEKLDVYPRVDTYGKNNALNGRLEDDLAIAYGEKYYHAHPKDHDKNNEASNRKFFGLDDPEQYAKVERAIELRRTFEKTKEWQTQAKYGTSTSGIKRMREKK